MILRINSTHFPYLDKSHTSQCELQSNLEYGRYAKFIGSSACNSPPSVGNTSMYASYKVGSAPLIMCMSGRGGMKSFPTRNPIRTYKLKTTNNYVCHKYKRGIF
jgi:hypothetical protein